MPDQDAGRVLLPARQLRDSPGHAYDASEPWSDPLQPVARLLLVNDFLFVVIAVGAAAALRWHEALATQLQTNWLPLVGMGMTWQLALAFAGAYDTRKLVRGYEEFRGVWSGSLWTVGVVGFFGYATKLPLSRGFVLLAAPIGVVLLSLSRFFIRRRVQRSRIGGRFQSRTLLVGTPADVDAMANVLATEAVSGLAVTCTVPLPSSSAEMTDEWLASIVTTARTQRVQAVVISSPHALSRDALSRLGWDLTGSNIDLLVTPDFGQIAGPRSIVRPATGLPLVHLDEPPLSQGERLIKRILDIVLVVPLLILSLPVFLLVALAIKLTSPGPVFFVQERIGYRGHAFRFPKFRSMVEDAHSQWHEVVGTSARDEKQVEPDPRVTRVGEWLRRLSLDELPQLLCVLQGSMSLVGPRPMIYEELPLLGPADHQRHLTKPGMTGLWQVSGRKHLTWEERMQLDLYYVTNWSPLLDGVILMRTVRAVLRGDGAY